MPTYDYKCAHCGYAFEKFLSISKRDEPLTEPCPSCNVGGQVEKMVASPLIVSESGDFITKTPDWFKSRMKAIKKKHPRSTIDVH